MGHGGFSESVKRTSAGDDEDNARRVCGVVGGRELIRGVTAVFLVQGRCVEARLHRGSTHRPRVWRTL